MAPKKTRTKSKSTDAKPTVATTRLLRSRAFRAIWRPVPLLVMALGSAGVLFWPQIVQRLPNLSRRAEYQFTWSTIDVTPPAQWVPEDIVGQVRRRSGLDGALSLLDESLVTRLAAAFAEHPWVAEVVSVKKSSRAVSVRLVYRSPVLMVQTKRGLYPVDGEGVLLPPSDFTAADAELFPRVEGVDSLPHGPSGVRWGDPAVAGASRLAVELTHPRDGQSAWEEFGLEAIVVLSQSAESEPNDAVLFGLTTTSGSRIVWGHAPGADTLEPTVEQKLLRLERFVADHGRFEEMPDPILIYVHEWDMIRWDVRSSANGASSAPR